MRSIENLAKQFDRLMKETGGVENLIDNTARFKDIRGQLAALKGRRNCVLSLRAENNPAARGLQRAAAVMNTAPAGITEWNKNWMRQLPEEV